MTAKGYPAPFGSTRTARDVAEGNRPGADCVAPCQKLRIAADGGVVEEHLGGGGTVRVDDDLDVDGVRLAGWPVRVARREARHDDHGQGGDDRSLHGRTVSEPSVQAVETLKRGVPSAVVPDREASHMTTTQQVRTATHAGATAEQLRARRQEHVARARAAHLMLAARRARHGADAAAVAAAAAPDDERLLRQAQALEATADHVETAATAARREWALASLGSGRPAATLRRRRPGVRRSDATNRSPRRRPAGSPGLTTYRPGRQGPCQTWAEVSTAGAGRGCRA